MNRTHKKGKELCIGRHLYGLRPMHSAFFVVMLFVVSFLASCSGKDAVPAQFYTIENAQWPYDKTFVFNEKGDTLPGQVKALELSLRHTNEYPYANVWLEISYSSSDSIMADTFNIRLADDYGKWLGAGSGPVVMKTDTLIPRHVPDSTSRFTLRHVMRIDILPEIEQVGMAFISD